MADIKVSQLPAAVAVAPEDTIMIVQGATSKKVSLSVLLDDPVIGVLTTVSSPYAMLSTDRFKIIDATAGDFVFNMLSSSDPNGKSIMLQRDRADPGTYTVSIVPAGGETLGKGGTITLLPGETIKLYPDGGTDYIQI